jgi:hypothetical protein
LVLLGSGVVDTSEGATGQIAVYFDSAGTQRAREPRGAGLQDTVYVFGEDFEFLFANGAEYSIDYGPHMSLFFDFFVPPVTVGRSDTGISMGFGGNIRPGKKFLMQKAVITWLTDGCADPNSDFPRVKTHPLTADTTPVVQNFLPRPDGSTIPAFGARSQTCQIVELDIQPEHCPNSFSEALWDTLPSARKGGILELAIVGSPTVDVADIDPASCRLEGVWAMGSGLIRDVSMEAGMEDCECNGLGGDGFPDLELQFLSADLAAAIPEPNPGDTLTLTLTGSYNDGMPFSAFDCVIIVPGGISVCSSEVSTAPILGLPRPNPFNPTTQLRYSIPVSQHVNIAVYDVKGRLLDVLVNEIKTAGDHVIEWNAQGLPSGVYFYRLQTGTETMVRRATLLK